MIEKKKIVEIQDEGLFLYEDREEMSEEKRRPRPKITLIPFLLSDEWYAVDIENVVEVVKPSNITHVPGVSDFIIGVTNVRGNIISVTDFKDLFTLAEAEIGPKTRVVVVRASKKTTGLVVDSVGKAIAVPLDSIQPALSTLPAVKAEYIQGGTTLADGRMLTVLDMAKILASEQMTFE